jgi:hypothetical protein
MSLRSDTSRMESPVQHHPVGIANDLQWIEGELETLGNPHNFINQDGLDVLTISNALVAPWSFSGLPNSHADPLLLRRDNVQLLVFSAEDALAEYRDPPRTETLIISLPLAVVRGRAPFLSEARIGNFLDFWKGTLFPLSDVQIHYLARAHAGPPAQARLIYINRAAIQSYTGA